MNTFKDRLQELISENDINRLKLAKSLDISSTTINGYFNKDYFPQIDIAIKIATYFDCSLDFLFGISDKKETCKKYNLKNFSRNFKTLIKANNLSIATAMQKLKMSEYNYYRWKDGKFPKTINLVTIAKTFNCSIDDLIR